MPNLYIPVCAFFISTLLLIIFFGKRRVNNKETKIFSGLVVTSFIDSIMMVAIITIGYIDDTHFSLYILNRIDFIQYLGWSWLFFLYIYYVSMAHKENGMDKYNRAVKITKIINIISLVFILTLPLYLHSKNDVMYSYGPSVTVLYICCGIYILLSFAVTLFNAKHIKSKKYLPILALLVLGTLTLGIRAVQPGLLVIPFVMTYINLIMYFTIENPDLKMIEELNVARMHAERANLAKSEFLSSMSHEIRTPLNAIVGFSDCILRENDLQVAKEDAKDIVTASKNLLEIVNGILDISKIEANKMEIVETDYNPRETIYNLVKLVVPRIGEKPIEMKVGITQDLPQVLHGDVKKLKQIITNILTNAVKYTDKGTITVMVTCLNQEGISLLSISVEDTGRGIKPEKIDKLFNKFERLDEDRNTTIEGTGLGLAITKRLVEMMGGKIIVQSKFGEGSKFTVYLKQRISDQKEVKEENKTVVAKHYPGKKILVVDDNKINLKVATKILKELEISVEEVDNGFSCIEKIQNGEDYDMILLDDMMPRMSGSETLVQLKKIPAFSIPVIALTANAIEGMKEEYLKKGFDDYLAKPISRKELYRVLNQFLDGHQEGENGNKIDFGPLPQEIFEFSTTLQQEKTTYDLDYLKNKGIDVDKGLSLLGDEETYREMMTTFLQEIDQKIEKMKTFISEKNAKEYAVLAHGVKSDAKYFGFTELADIAYQHELKGKDNNIDFITTHWEEFEQEINRMKEIIRPYLDK